ncbi:MAG: hypothetical protein M1818_001328 [Claussenomyces sp. TS43310]|nr:MAG: hypothetical protein M1818_001328 [Claussenomyces sp. TS43310]
MTQPREIQSDASEQERRDATEDEVATLRHIGDDIPRSAWIALLLGAAERFTFYAVTAPWQNYMQNDADSIAVPGALGLGQATATNISNAFYFFAALSPLPFAVISDVWLGRYKTLCVSFVIYVCACIVMFVTSLPGLGQPETGRGGLGATMILLGLAAGGVKAAIAAFIGDQYTPTTPQLITKKNGERVVGDRTLTIQYIFNVYYWFTNIASLSTVASTYLEKECGFWTAYLMGLSSFSVAVVLLVLWRKDFVKHSPEGNAIPRASRVLLYAAKDRFRLDAAKRKFQHDRYQRSVPWDDRFVEEIKRALIACKVMTWFVLFFLCMNQIGNNLISQAGQMQLHHVPNDAIPALNPVACVILGPIIQKGLYPFLQKRKIEFRPIARMTVAFIFMSASMAYAAIVQRLIYNSGPCYEDPLACPASNAGSAPNNINVWIQVPVYFLVAAAEIFGFATLFEYSYSKAPKDMKSLVQALSMFASCIASALGMALSTVSTNPEILYLYAALAAAMIMSSLPFWLWFKRYDEIDEELNRLGLDEEEEKDKIAQSDV